MKAAETLVPLVIAVVIGGLLLVGQVILHYPLQVLMFPAMIGVATCLVCLVHLGSKCKRPLSTAAEIPSLPATQRSDFILLLQLGTILPCLILFGFIGGCALWVAGFMRGQGEAWRLACIIGLATMAFVYIVFELLLRIALPPGILGQ